MKMQNICFFNSIKFWGGGEKFSFEYALGFERRGYNIFVVCNKNSVLSQKVRKHNLTQFNINVSVFSFLNPIKIIKLVLFFKKNNIDTIIFSSSEDSKLAGFAAKLARVEKIVYRRGLAAIIKNRFINRILFRKVFTHILANSEETKRTILQNLNKYIHPSKIKVIYNGIRLNEINKKNTGFMKIIQEKAKGVILGNAGRLTTQKGHHHLLDVCRILKNKQLEFTLFIAGGGELKEKLNNMIKEYHLQNEVILLDFVNDMESFMHSIDIFLLSSIWEGFGYVLVEAMIKSKPVVAFNLSSNSEIVTEDKTGFLVKYPDIQMFAEKTYQLMEDVNLRKVMGEQAKKSVYNKFNQEQKLTELENYLMLEPK